MNGLPHPTNGNDRYGFIAAPSGKVALDAIYVDAELFSEGLAAASFDEKGVMRSGFIDKTGNLALDATNAAWVPVFGGYSTEGEAARPGCGESMYHEGLAVVQTKTSRGFVFIDKKGVVRSSEEFTLACPFENGVSLVIDQKGVIKLIDPQGKVLAVVPRVSARFLEVEPFLNGLAKIKFQADNFRDEWGYINLQGKIVWESH